jgi:hypothetical protein
MPILSWLLRILFALASLLFLISHLFEKQLQSEYSITLPISKYILFRQVNDLSTWPEWTSWKMNDSSAIIQYGKKYVGMGASMSWKNDQGSGSIKITEIPSDSLLKAVIEMGGWKTIYSTMRLNAVDSGSVMIWQLSTVADDPISRIMGYFIKGWMLRDIKRGLRGLNVWLMNQGLTEGKILSVDYYGNTGKTYYSLTLTDTFSSLPDDGVRQTYFSKIEREIADWRLEQAHDPYIHIRKWPIDTLPIIIDFGITIEDVSRYKGGYKVEQHQRSFINATFAGPMHQWNMVLDSIHQYAGKIEKKIECDPYITFARTPLENGIYKGIYTNTFTLFEKERY